MFTSKLNTMTGKMDWEVMSDDYDYQQELARAGFADMLHDYERVIACSANTMRLKCRKRSKKTTTTTTTTTTRIENTTTRCAKWSAS